MFVGDPSKSNSLNLTNISNQYIPLANISKHIQPKHINPRSKSNQPWPRRRRMMSRSISGLPVPAPAPVPPPTANRISWGQLRPVRPVRPAARFDRLLGRAAARLNSSICKATLHPVDHLGFVEASALEHHLVTELVT